MNALFAGFNPGRYAYDEHVCVNCGKVFRTAVVNSYHSNQTLCPDCRRILEGRHISELTMREGLLERKARAGIPNRFMDASLDGFVVSGSNMAHAVEVCGQFVNGVYTNLILTGATGVGKTHLVCATLNKIMAERAGQSVCYISEANLYRIIRETYSEKTSERKALNRLASYDYLAIDEMGRATWSDADKRVLFDLINARYNNASKTIIASNMTPESFVGRDGSTYVGLRDYLGEAVARRILDVRCGEIVCSWPKYQARG